MLFTQFASGKRRIIAIGGAALFTLFLLYDFNRLAQLDARGVNDWGTALNLAISSVSRHYQSSAGDPRSNGGLNQRPKASIRVSIAARTPDIYFAGLSI